MEQEKYESLASRLTGLEQKYAVACRCLLILGLLCIMALATQAVSIVRASAGPDGPAPVAKVIEAESFVLRDDQGRKRATLAIDSKGAGLRLLNTDGLARAEFYAQQTGGFVVINAGTGKTVAQLSGCDTEATLMLADKEGRTRANLHTVLGSTSLYLVDEEDHMRVSMAIMKGGPPRILLLDARTWRVVMQVPPSKRDPYLQVFDANKTPLFTVP